MTETEEAFQIYATVMIKNGNMACSLLTTHYNSDYSGVTYGHKNLTRGKALETINSLFDRIEAGQWLHRKHTPQELQEYSDLVTAFYPVLGIKPHDPTL
jgi:hypothetical protein